MRVVAIVKRVPDTASVFKISGDNRSVVKDNLKYVINPYDEMAVEAAVRVKEANGAEVIIVSVGDEGTQETMRTALAMGADSGLLVVHSGEERNLMGTAKLLAAALKTLAPDLIFAGKQAVDSDGSQVAERVAELLNLPHVSVISKFQLAGNVATVGREVEGTSFTIEVPLPALFTVDKTLNPVRYPTLPNIMKAKKKPIVEKKLADLGLTEADVKSQISTETMELPRKERRKQILAGDKDAQVRDLLNLLREKDQIL